MLPHKCFFKLGPRGLFTFYNMNKNVKIFEIKVLKWIGIIVNIIVIDDPCETCGAVANEMLHHSLLCYASSVCSPVPLKLSMIIMIV